MGCYGITRNEVYSNQPKTKRAFPQRDQRRSKKLGVWAFWNVLGGLFFIAMRPLAGPVGVGIFLFVWGVSVRPSARLLITGGAGAEVLVLVLVLVLVSVRVALPGGWCWWHC